MFQTFTGNTRRPRQVNLQNRTTNPFASNPFAPRPSTPNKNNQTRNTLAQVHAERALRQRERLQLQSARTIQRVWRGCLVRRRIRAEARRAWDSREAEREPRYDAREWLSLSSVDGAPVRGYLREEDALAQMRHLLLFARVEGGDGLDGKRMAYFAECLVRSRFSSLLESPASPLSPVQGQEQPPSISLLRFARRCLGFLRTYASLSPAVPAETLDPLLKCLIALIAIIPVPLARIAQDYYTVMAMLTVSFPTLNLQNRISKAYLLEAVKQLPRHLHEETITAYEWFARAYLTTPNLEEFLGGDGDNSGLREIALDMNYKILGKAMLSRGLGIWDLSSTTPVVSIPSTSSSAASSVVSTPTSKDKKRPKLAEESSRLWLLAHYIYLQRHSFGDESSTEAPDAVYAEVVSLLLGSASGDLATRFSASTSRGSHHRRQSRTASKTPLPAFVKRQLETLVNQNSITNLLSHADHDVAAEGRGAGEGPVSVGMSGAGSLASYALALLRLFPRRGDEIRMWLYLGSTAGTTRKVPAIIYFWQATKRTKVFRNISSDPKKVLRMLQPLPSAESTEMRHTRDQEWTVILVFLELYTFLLKVLDDEEFFNAGVRGRVGLHDSTSWTRESSLPLQDVKDLTVFLKNLAFTVYWHASDLSSAEDGHRENDANGRSMLGSHFGTATPASPSRPSSATDGRRGTTTRKLAGVTGIPLDYLKGLVTGLLRMVHERDSRRPFLPEGFWLMVDRIDMTGFIASVVQEEEKRLELQEEHDNDDDNARQAIATAADTVPATGSDNDDLDSESETDADASSEYENATTPPLIGTARTQQLRRLESLRRRQQLASRAKELESIAPRLEILRNMPFFIPFETRVQIFREFVFRDQERRRGRGNTDPDSWRMSVAHGLFSLGRAAHGGLAAANDVLARHHANIHRDSVFDDAYHQFWELGDGLKEPIHISFIDQFGAEEAGIDGGGVTKEFLTSVISDAFNPVSEFEDSYFLENDDHLLYPNPTLVEQRKEMIRQMGMAERSGEYAAQVRDLLKRYEFLGRIIGKCLYEGILVDVRFAGFFLLKWALTGGTGSARKESGYRANLNDLRDLDRELYQGLLLLKNYPGDVEELGLTFTVDDAFNIPDITMEDRNTVVKKRISKTRELKPNGANIPVTNQNRLVYISYVARHRLQVQPFLQTQAFLQGLGKIVQPSWLSMFNQNELQTLVAGNAGEVDVDDLRRHTIYSGLYEIGDDGKEHPTCVMFWETLKQMDNAERQKVLKFVTSTARAPLLGFGHLNPKFSIRDSGNDEERLPSASTCANLLKLPVYRSREVLGKKLGYAINAEAGFDLS